jgi:uncharacterized protein YjbI with pentapeptide repeats
MNARELRRLQQQHILGSHAREDLSHLWCVKVNFANYWFYRANFSGADLRLADLRNTDLYGANLSDADLRDAELF